MGVKVKLTKFGHTGHANIEGDQVFAALIELSGGGYNEQQVAKAMQFKDELFSKSSLKVGDYFLELIENTCY